MSEWLEVLICNPERSSMCNSSAILRNSQLVSVPPVGGFKNVFSTSVLNTATLE